MADLPGILGRNVSAQPLKTLRVAMRAARRPALRRHRHRWSYPGEIAAVIPIGFVLEFCLSATCPAGAHDPAINGDFSGQMREAASTEIISIF
jgi:hypothetical protein